MPTPLLTTKFYIPPPRPGLVPRPHLIRRLDEGLRLGHKLTLVSAAAGSGKTTLLSEWINLLPTPKFAWLSLDEEDNDVSHFWTYLIAALQAVQAGLGQASLQPLDLPQPSPIQLILTPLLNDIAALSDRIVLILDDYHVISTPAIHAGISFLLDHQPQQLHLVLATRADPPLPTARLRAGGQLTELRAEDLRFTPEEVTAFLNDAMGLGLRAEDIAALEARTEGWVAGLHLAALSLQGHEEPHAFIEAFTGSHHYILEYLITEVLSRQPEAVQRFLLQTSILDQLHAPLCDTLTGECTGADMLERAQRDNLFIIPLDDERLWYRYHHLFADLLRKRLAQATPPERVFELHRRASRWYEENGFIARAIKHARMAKDHEQVARLAEQAAGASLLDSRLTTLLRWVDTLPEGVLRAHPRLQIYRAWALFMNGHLDLAQQALQGCRQALDDLPPSPENDALRHELGRLLETIDMIAQGLMHSMDNEIEKAIQTCSQARDMALEDGHVFLAAQATEGLALALYYRGRLQASAQLCQQVIDLAEQSSVTVQRAVQVPLAAAGYVELAGIHMEWNDLGMAADLLEQALALCHQVGTTQTLNEAYTAQSRLKQALGDIEGAWEVLERAREVGSIEGEHSMANFRLSTQQARLNLQAGELAPVVRWVEETKAAFTPDGETVQLPTAFIETLQTILARALLARGEPEAALTVLVPLLAPAEAKGAFRRVIEVCLLKALALQASGDTSGALAALERSLALAEPEGYARLYLDEGSPAEALLRQATACGIARAYADRLLNAFSAERQRDKDAEKIAPATPVPPHPAALVEPLTRREMEVLQLIAEGCSNRDIADRLVIALNTVKRHTSNIYGKLGAKNRTQAVAQARHLGLIGEE